MPSEMHGLRQVERVASMDSAFIPAFTLAVNYYSLVRPTLTHSDLWVCVRKCLGQKTALSILDHQHRTQLRLRVQRRVRLWGFSSRRLRFMLVLSVATSDFTSSLLVMGCASPADFFRSYFKLTLTALFQRISILTGLLCTASGPAPIHRQYTRDHHRTPSSASSETVSRRIYHF